jgi:hypothetical protein
MLSPVCYDAKDSNSTNSSAFFVVSVISHGDSSRWEAKSAVLQQLYSSERIPLWTDRKGPLVQAECHYFKRTHDSTLRSLPVGSLKPDAKPTHRFLATLLVNDFTRFLWLIRSRRADMCIVLTLTTIAARSVGYIQMKISGCASPTEEDNLHHANGTEQQWLPILRQ